MKCVAIIVLIGSLSIGLFAQMAKTNKGSEKAKPAPGSERSGSEKKPGAAPPSTPDEKTVWEAVLAIQKPGERASAVKEFLANFPESAIRAQANEVRVRSEAEEGYLRLQVADTEEAYNRFAAAAKESSSPLEEKLFIEVLSKLPASLYFGGAREQGLQIAGILEEKVQTNADQILNIANFFLSIENGTKARELAETAIKVKPESSTAYETLGLANRMDFRIEESAAAYEKALQLRPESASARRGLAEMKRALGKSDEAVQLFQDILRKEPGNVPARTGLILSMFEAGQRSEAETEFANAINENPGNIILLAGAAYWHASQDNGERAVELAQKAINTDPRFIWSHIALARGLVLLNKPYDAERTLLAARRYGNFPTLEFEIASARLAAGFFRDAVEELAKSFSISEGKVRTKLGGRITRDADDFAELVGLERRASILSPHGAPKPEVASKLFNLLEMTQIVESLKHEEGSVQKAVDRFVDGNDKMKLHRQLFSAAMLLEKKIELAKAIDLVQSAVTLVDEGIDAPFSRSAILASELYENRNIAVARGEYLNVPEVPRTVLSSIVRGRIEEINGWAKYQMGDAPAAVVRLKRAVSVLPVNSAWWQSASWRLGSALALSGQDAEALDAYVKTFKAGNTADGFRYDTIAALYQKIHGNMRELESLIGPDPRQPGVSAPTLNGRTVETENKDKQNDPIEKTGPLRGEVQVALRSSEVASSPSPAQESPTGQNVTLKTSHKTDPPKESAPGIHREPSPDQAAVKSPEVARPTGESKDIFPPVVITIPLPDLKTVADKNKAIPYLPNPVPLRTEHSDNTLSKDHHSLKPKPANALGVTTSKTTSGDGLAVGNALEPSRSIIPCSLNPSEDNLTVSSDGGGKAVIVGTDDDIDLEGIKGLSSSPENVTVRREPIPGIATRALYVIKGEGARPGVYQVTFELPCGKKVIVVRVR